MFVRDSLKEIFKLVQYSFLTGAHVFCSYKQCGYKDDDVDCLREVSTGNQSGRFPAGKRHILPDAQDSSTSDNHLHLFSRPCTYIVSSNKRAPSKQWFLETYYS